MHRYRTRAATWIRVPSLPQEILNSIFEYANGDLHTFTSRCLTGKQFNLWAQFEAPQMLASSPRDRGIRLCDACYRILPPQRWVALGPQSWDYKIDCITRAIRELSTTGPSSDQIGRLQRPNPAYRPCLCCMYDYGAKKCVLVQQKLNNNGVFCERYMVRMRPKLGDLRMALLALQCIIMYLARLFGG
jgi:hypothetical protein